MSFNPVTDCPDESCLASLNFTDVTCTTYDELLTKFNNRTDLLAQALCCVAGSGFNALDNGRYVQTTLFQDFTVLTQCVPQVVSYDYTTVINVPSGTTHALVTTQISCRSGPTIEHLCNYNFDLTISSDGIKIADTVTGDVVKGTQNEPTISGTALVAVDALKQVHISVDGSNVVPSGATSVNGFWFNLIVEGYISG